MRNASRAAPRKPPRCARSWPTRSADEWEAFLQSRHVPAGRVRRMDEALADPQIAARGLTHRFEAAEGVAGPFAVPVAAFGFAHGGPRVDAPPRPLGADTDAILAEFGYDEAARQSLRDAGAV